MSLLEATEHIAEPGPSHMIPRSDISDVSWPALPAPDGALLLAIYHQLCESQWLGPEMLERLQFQALGRLLRHAIQTVPHYRDRHAYAAIAEASALTNQAWRQLPILTRARCRRLDQP